MAMNPKLLRPKRSVVYHPEALAWQSAVVANGGTVGNSLKPVSEFCTAIDAAGIRDRFLRLNLVCGGNLAAARTPLYRGASVAGTQYGSAADVNNGPFVEGDYSESTGLNGNGNNKYFDTTATIGMLALFGADGTNVHASVYNRTSTQGPHFGFMDDSGLESNAYVACVLDTSAYLWGDPLFATDGYYQESYVSAATGTAPDGFWVGEQTSATTGKLTRNGVDVTSGPPSLAVTYQTTDNLFLWFGGVNATGGAYLSTGRLSAYSVGKAFTSSGQRTAFYDAMVALQTALGRI